VGYNCNDDDDDDDNQFVQTEKLRQIGQIQELKKKDQTCSLIDMAVPENRMLRKRKQKRK